jgi:hypothetical protein
VALPGRDVRFALTELCKNGLRFSVSSVTITAMIRRMILLLALTLLLVGCGTTPVITTSVVTTDALPSATTEVVTTWEPTLVATITPSPAPGLVLIGGSETVAADVQQAVEALAAESGWTVETAPLLDAASLRPETKLILWLGDPTQARSLADAAPQVRVIATSPQAAEATANLTWIVLDADQQAFAAGYISMLMTDDWRLGGLLPAEPASWTEAFLNGGRYLCGRCIPLYAPIVEFPVASSLPSGSPASAVLDALTLLNSQNYLEIVFIHPQISSDELLNQLAGQDYIYVGLQSPPQVLKAQWGATVGFDIPASLRQAWPQADAAGAVISAPLALQDVNSEFLTEGKIRLVNQVLQDLQNGLVSSLFVVP